MKDASFSCNVLCSAKERFPYVRSFFAEQDMLLNAHNHYFRASKNTNVLLVKQSK